MPSLALLSMIDRRFAFSQYFRPVRISLQLTVASAPYLPSTCVSPTEVELPLRLVLCYYEEFYRKTGYYFTSHTP